MTTCDRFLQRLNLSLRNWIHQDFPKDQYEVLVASSLDDDGVRNYLSHLQAAYPQVSITAIENEPGKTKLEYQQSLVDRSRGRVLVLVDSDMVFPTNFLGHLSRLDVTDGLFIWLARAYLSREQTYQAILGDLRLDDPALFGRPLQGTFAGCEIYERGPSGFCHVYTRNTFRASNGFEGIEVQRGRWGVFASLMLQKMESLGTVKRKHKIEEFLAYHLWHGGDGPKPRWDGANTIW
jgi:cellulose synthase/poly-beta-1,6-N-acetylglucosamine synthase-like glycosyltransferase